MCVRACVCVTINRHMHARTLHGMTIINGINYLDWRDFLSIKFEQIEQDIRSISLYVKSIAQIIQKCIQYQQGTEMQATI